MRLCSSIFYEEPNFFVCASDVQYVFDIIQLFCNKLSKKQIAGVKSPIFCLSHAIAQAELLVDFHVV